MRIAALMAASARAGDNAGRMSGPTGEAAQRASAFTGGEAPSLTGKERLGNKWNDEQRLDDCNVPPDQAWIEKPAGRLLATLALNSLCVVRAANRRPLGPQRSNDRRRRGGRRPHLDASSIATQGRGRFSQSHDEEIRPGAPLSLTGPSPPSRKLRSVALRRTTPVLVNRDRLWWVATAAVIAANALLLTTAHLAQAPLEPFARWALRAAVSY